MKSNLFFSSLLTTITSVFILFENSYSQTINANSYLTSTAYESDPKEYLSNLNKANLSTDMLVDRYISNIPLSDYSGTGAIKIGTTSTWKSIYNSCRYSLNDIKKLPDVRYFDTINNFYYKQKNLLTIGVVNFAYNRITQSALNTKDFVEVNNKLVDSRSKANSYTKARVFAACLLNNNAYGDNLSFTISPSVFASNIKTEKISKIEVDFGNNSGYQEVAKNEVYTIFYTSVSAYVNAKIRITYQNTITSFNSSFVAGFTFFRKGSDIVPLASPLKSKPNARKSFDFIPPSIFYPEGTCISGPRFCYPGPDIEPNYIEECGTTYGCDGQKLEVTFFFNPLNNTGKLRRPFLICDGFDPKNQRNVYESSFTDKKTQKDNDHRGLWELLNGNPSPWYPNVGSANFVATLQNMGYDIIFVDFLDGAGRIQDNASAFRGLLNDVLNSSAYRDSETEELVVVGPSMGGLVTRYAITSMEQASPVENHYIKSWVSFDSPHNGAYIPDGLTLTINRFRDLNDINNTDLMDAKETFSGVINEQLGSAAARQMLVHHISRPNCDYGTDEYYTLYSELATLGYPKQTFNYGLTNGGTSNLYSGNGGNNIVHFKAKWVNYIKSEAYSHQNGAQSQPIAFIHVKVIEDEKVWSQKNIVGLDNAPGGWNTALYSFNLSSSNVYNISDSDVPRTKASFIPTCSALGKEVPNTTNIYRTWEYYQKNPLTTPFDRIRGVKGISEEHITITEETKLEVQDVLQSQLDNGRIPMLRAGSPLPQNITRPVRYAANKTLTIAGDGNVLNIRNTKVNMVAGSAILILPGFSVNAGSELSVSIKSMSTNNLSNKRIGSKSESKTYVDYNESSPYAGKIIKVSNSNDIELSSNHNSDIKITPNPASSNVTITWSNDYGNALSIHIINSVGKNTIDVYGMIGNSQEINLQTLPQGLYLVKVIYENGESTQKIVKN